MHRTGIIFMVLEVGKRGAAGLGIIRNAKECYRFHGFGSGWEGGRLASESQEMRGIVIIFMVWEVAGGGRVVL